MSGVVVPVVDACAIAFLLARPNLLISKAS